VGLGPEGKDTPTLETPKAEDAQFYEGNNPGIIEPPLDSQVQITRWQESIEESNYSEELAVALFNACNEVFPRILLILSQQRDIQEASVHQDLREQFRKFYVWNDIFPTISGELDKILSLSRNLKITVMGLLAQWGRLVCRGMYLTMRRSSKQYSVY
jgi:hypothetical protein